MFFLLCFLTKNTDKTSKYCSNEFLYLLHSYDYYCCVTRCTNNFKYMYIYTFKGSEDNFQRYNIVAIIHLINASEQYTRVLSQVPFNIPLHVLSFIHLHGLPAAHQRPTHGIPILLDHCSKMNNKSLQYIRLLIYSTLI